MSLLRDNGEAIEVELPGGARGLFTTRAAGNLSLSAGERHEHGLQARHRLCAELGLRWLCASPQVHGAEVTRVLDRAHDGGQPLAAPADGHATTLRGVGVMVLAADCVPVLLAAPGAVAAVHAGWRGMAAGVLEQGVAALRELSGAREPRGGGKPGGGGELSGGTALRELSGAREPGGGTALHDGRERGDGSQPRCAGGPHDGVGPRDVGRRGGGDRMVAVIGPCAGACCYEVGAEVLAALGEPAPPAGSAKAMLDLRAAARRRLAAAGVETVIDVERCTICDERTFSHRREGAAAGRQGAVAWLP